MNKPSRTPGICRIDQPEKHNHGFFVRLHRRGKIHSKFFSDKRHGGRPQALAAAQKHFQELLKKFGLTKPMPRRLWAQIRRLKGSTGMVGVRRIVVKRPDYKQAYWKASWSPRLGVVRKRMFSVRKHGARKAKALAIRARKEGLRNMAD
jgi:hypothetical protein